MSRTPFWLPPGQQSRVLPKFRLEGVEPNSPEAHELARVFGPMIKQFYLKMAQQHMLGIVDQSKGHRQFGDALSMSYLNQMGQETVTVKVAPQLRKKLVEKPKHRTNFLVLELQMPAPGVYQYAIARRRRGRFAQIAEPLPLEGLMDTAVYANGDVWRPENTWPPPIDWAEEQFGFTNIDAQSVPSYCSVLVDLWDVADKGAAFVDIYLQPRAVPLKRDEFLFTDAEQVAGIFENTHPDSQAAYPTLLGVKTHPTSGILDASNTQTMLSTEFTHHNPSLLGIPGITKEVGAGPWLSEIFVWNANGTTTGLGVNGRIEHDVPVLGWLPVDFWQGQQDVDPSRLTGVCNVFGEVFLADPTNGQEHPTLGTRAALEPAETDHILGVIYTPVRANRWARPDGTGVRLPQIATIDVTLVDHDTADDIENVGGVDTMPVLPFFGVALVDLERGTVTIDTTPPTE